MQHSPRAAIQLAPGPRRLLAQPCAAPSEVLACSAPAGTDVLRWPASTFPLQLPAFPRCCSLPLVMTGSCAEQAAPLGSAGVLWRYLLLHRCRSNTEDTAKGHIYRRATSTLFHTSFRSPAQTSIPLCSSQRGRTSFSAAFPFTLSHLLQPASSLSTLFPLSAWLVAHGWHWWTLLRSHMYVLSLLTPRFRYFFRL